MVRNSSDRYLKSCTAKQEHAARNQDELNRLTSQRNQQDQQLLSNSTANSTRQSRHQQAVADEVEKKLQRR